MATPVIVSRQDITGRAGIPDPNVQRVGISVNADFSSAANLEFDFNTVYQDKVFGIIRSFYINNATNPSSVDVFVSLTNQTLNVAPNTSGYFPISAAIGSKITFTTAGGATEQVNIQFFNYEQSPIVYNSSGFAGAVTIANGADVAEGDTGDTAWDGIAANATVIAILKAIFGEVASNAVTIADGADITQGAIADAVVAAGAAGTISAKLRRLTTDLAAVLALVVRGGAWTDRSIASLSGASEELMAANVNRKYLLIQNIAANAMGVNLVGGAAAIGTAGTVTLLPGGSIELEGYASTSQINIIGTATDDVTAYEG